MKYIKRHIKTSKFPYAIEFMFDSSDQTTESDVYQWCTENFGVPSPNGDEMGYKWIKSLFGLRFKDEAHLNWCIMRFSS